MKTVTLAMTGASGAAYGVRLLECLLHAGIEVRLLLSSASILVIRDELDLQLNSHPEQQAKLLTGFLSLSQDNHLTCYHKNDWYAPVASGTAVSDAMVICPCSSGTLSAVAAGLSDTLLRRAADVTLKEQKKLILVHRETPISLIHIENMRTLALAGATILPANPGFYYKPQEITDIVDFVVARVLDQLQVGQKMVPKWGLRPSN